MSPFLPLIPLAPLYAETHYRFRFVPSWLWKAEPEVVVDLPHRIEAGKDLPILLLVKDADRFPASISNIQVNVSQADKELFKITLTHTPVQPQDRFWWKVWNIPLSNVSGSIEVDVSFELRSLGQTKIYRADNFRSSSQRPFHVHVSASPMPIFHGWYAGEGHSHSDRTDDQVEFGIPPAAALALSVPMGLSFACVTDHSYDLDDHPHDFLQNHSDLPKWHALRHELGDLNDQNQNFVFIRGEEVSCRTAKDENVHMLLLGNAEYVPGSGDSAERWFQTRSEFSIKEVLRKKTPGSVAIAAHARESASWLQRALLGRGIWEREDLENSGLDGIQFANGKDDEAFRDGLRVWISLLLAGKRLVLLGGDDAHGNFNRFRQIGIPFVTIREGPQQLFGVTRTVVRCESLSEEALLAAVKSGRSVVSDGPVLDIRKDGVSMIGMELQTGKIELEIHHQTSPEYGNLESLRVFHGTIGGHEHELSVATVGEGLGRVGFVAERRGYVRAECWTKATASAYGRKHFCFSNPVWIQS